MIKKYNKLVLLSIFLLQIDQLSKMFIRDNIKMISDKGNEIIPNFFYITKVENTGAAWGSLSGNTVLLSLISIIVFILLIKYVSKERITPLRIVYYSMLFAGILGNLIDRMFLGYVTDFLNFYIFTYDYPVFNIADIFIVLGVLLCLVDIARGEIYDM